MITPEKDNLERNYLSEDRSVKKELILIKVTCTFDQGNSCQEK